MSSRLIAIMLLFIAHPAMAQTETTTEAAEQAAEVVEQEVSQAAESASDVVAESVDTAETAAENAEQAAEELTEEAAAKAEEMVDEATQATEEATTSASEATEEATAKVEEMADETTQATEEAAATTTETTEEVVEEAVETTAAATEEVEAAVEETAEQAETTTEEATESAEAATESAEETTETAMATDGGLEAKLAACAACHGMDGNSVIPQNPKLAGQVHGFIADQLAKFKSGERDNAIMAAQVANLTEEDMLAIDAFYEAQQPQLGAISEDMQELAAEGEKIYRGGEPSMSISACMSCHGPSGDGIPTRFPRVGGQHIEYLEQQLLAYKSGSRASEEMNPIAFRLSEHQIKALAAYMHALK